VTDAPLHASPIPSPAAPAPQPRRRIGRDTLPSVPPWLLITAALLAAVVVGRFMADGKIKYGAAIVLAACYVPLVLFDLAAALAVWVAILFFQDLTALSSGPNALGVLVALGWVGAFLGRKGNLPAIRQHRRLLLYLTLFALWLTLTIAWSQRAGPAGTEAGYWWLAALAFLIVLTTITTAREVRILALAFVIGAIGSVIIGLGSGSLKAPSNAIGQTAIQGRFTGGGGDPNVQAAAFVASMFLIIGLLSVYKRRAARTWLLLAFALVTLGFIATQSRGGLIALVVATVATLVLAPRHRKRILGLIGVAGIAIGVLVSVRPDALSRITNLGGGSSGRSDLWTVAWRVFTAHPLFGVGIGNFTVVENRYVLRPGYINRIQYLTDVPYLVHNTYLQLLAEAGVVGLAAFLIVVFGSLHASWRAVALFEAQGRIEYADLTRALMMGTIGMLTAVFFISDGDDLRLWVLLGLGPVMLTLATRGPTARARGRPRVGPPPAAPTRAPRSLTVSSTLEPGHG
jgi:O-antigen ligase